MPVKKLLIISNGHGEDSIAAEIVRRLPKSIEVNAYPTLGEGRAYEGVCPIVGPRRSLPSEGHRLRGSLIRDIFAGLGVGPALTFMRKEGKKYDAILVVGDMLGVIMSWFARRKVRIYLDVYKSGYDNAYSKSEIFILRRTAGTSAPSRYFREAARHSPGTSPSSSMRCAGCRASKARTSLQCWRGRATCRIWPKPPTCGSPRRRSASAIWAR
jgi:hypothetical protein